MKTGLKGEPSNVADGVGTMDEGREKSYKRLSGF